MPELFDLDHETRAKRVLNTLFPQRGRFEKMNCLLKQQLSSSYLLYSISLHVAAFYFFLGWLSVLVRYFLLFVVSIPTFSVFNKLVNFGEIFKLDHLLPGCL